MVEFVVVMVWVHQWSLCYHRWFCYGSCSCQIFPSGGLSWQGMLIGWLYSSHFAWLGRRSNDVYVMYSGVVNFQGSLSTYKEFLQLVPRTVARIQHVQHRDKTTWVLVMLQHMNRHPWELSAKKKSVEEVPGMLLMIFWQSFVCNYFWQIIFVL